MSLSSLGFAKRLCWIGVWGWGWCLLLTLPVCAQQNDIPNPFELSPELFSSRPADSAATASGPAQAASPEVADRAEAFPARPEDTSESPEIVEQAREQERERAGAREDSGLASAGTADTASGAEANDEAAPNEAAPNEAVAEEEAAEVDAADSIRVDAAALQDRDAVLDQSFANAYMIELKGPIFAKFRWFLQQRLATAKSRGADLVVLSLTTPGGDLEYSLELARALRDVDWATTIVFIPQEAISGGAILSLGADRIYMQEGALLGDAGPIRMGLDGQFEHAEEKVVSYLAEAIRALANAKQRPGALAEAMVDRNLKVYQATSRRTGQVVYLTEREIQAEGLGEQVQLGPVVPETGQNRFLTLDAQRAAQLDLCEGVFQSEAELLAALSVKRLERTELTWVDSLVYWLNRPWLTGLLLIVGLIGLYLELAAPGISVAGLTAVFCFGIFFWSHALGGTSGWLEVLLFILGIGCVACEMFVLPGFGVFGISGLVLVVLSLVMASQNFVVPSEPEQWQLFQRNLLVVLGAVMGVLLLLMAQVFLLDSIPGLNRLKLSAPLEGPEGVDFAAPLLGPAEHTQEAPQLGMMGIADSDLRPSGKVLVNGRLLDVVTEGDYVDAGSQVEIIRIEGNRTVVRKRAKA